ncbi:MAG TPA: hypothetical protein VEP90_15420 [Methylomirabilota bacterium]|nr:hypothetical protein [Methylomirabilota bacterium]
MGRRGGGSAKRHPAYGGGTVPNSSSSGGHRVGTFNVSKDGRSAHEHHGVGQYNPATGRTEFNDSTPAGKHSHTVHDTATGNVTYDRPEGGKP